MKKSLFSLAMLIAASALSATAATTEADFTAAREQAVSRLTSWAESSPFALEALSSGITNLNLIDFGSYSSGDAALKELNDAYDQTMAKAREQLTDEIYRTFVNLTTDALTAAPVDGKASLIGGEKLIAQEWDVPFKAYEAKEQCSTWIFCTTNSGSSYVLRNNNCNYITYSDYVEPNDEELCLSRDIEKDGYPTAIRMKVDFADNGRFSLKQGEKYLATRTDGTIYLTDTFGPESSWKMTRANDPKFDKPRVSTAKDPIYYVIRNANYPDLCLYGTGNMKFMNIGPIAESGQWYFVDTGRENGSFYAYTKDGYLIGTSSSGRLYSYTTKSGARPNPIYTYLRDGSDQYGLCLLSRSENAYTYSDTNPGHISYDPADGYVDMNQVKNTYHDWTGNPGVFSWYFEAIDEAEMSTLLQAKNEAVKLLKSYLASQPWGADFISRAITQIQAVNLADYTDGEAAAAAVRALLNTKVEALTGVINSEIGSYFSTGGRVAFYNVRRGVDVTAKGKPLTSVTANGKTTFNTIAGLPDSISAFEFETVKDGVFRIKTLKGAYLGAMKSGSPVEGVAKASAAEYKLALRDGYINLTNSTGRSALNLDATDGALTANQPADEGSMWVISPVNIVASRSDAPKVSTDSEIYYYVVHNLGDPTRYLLSSEPNWYLAWAGEEDRAYIYLTRAEDGNGVYINSMRYSGNQLFMNVDDKGKPENVSPVWYHGSKTGSIKSWYIIPNEHGTKEGFHISDTFPVSEKSCISVVSPGGAFSQITCGMGNADDYLNTSFVFEYREGLDHERLFNIKRNPIVSELRSYLTSQPWQLERIAREAEYLESCEMTDFGADSYVANSALSSYYYRVMNQLEAEMDYCPEDWVVAFSSVNRSGEYLASVNGKANTSATLNAASTWTLEYYSNGRYNLRNDNGEYLGAFSSSMEVTTDPARAGHFQIALYGGHITLVDRNKPSEGAVSVDAARGNACKAMQADPGALWNIEVVRQSSLSDINAAPAAAEYFDMRGIRVDESALTPGVYLKRTGTKAEKVIIK